VDGLPETVGMTALPWPDHLLTLDEWDELPEDRSRRFELAEGILIVSPRSAALHQRAMVRLADQLDHRLPRALTALADVEVLIEEGPAATVRAPDVVVTGAELAEKNPARLAASDVALAVEIVPPGTGRTDRVTKLFEYAQAGIPHYWLVELSEPVTLTAYTLAVDHYELVVSRASGTVTLTEPVRVELDLPALIAR
jgi:Uma2 family endonuclease